MKDFESKFKQTLIDKLGLEIAEIKPEARFATDLGADSLDMVELFMEFEHRFRLTIPDEEAEELLTVGDTYKYLLHRLDQTEE
jgi:acyl carrier protein